MTRIHKTLHTVLMFTLLILFALAILTVAKHYMDQFSEPVAVENITVENERLEEAVMDVNVIDTYTMQGETYYSIQIGNREYEDVTKKMYDTYFSGSEKIKTGGYVMTFTNDTSGILTFLSKKSISIERYDIMGEAEFTADEKTQYLKQVQEAFSEQLQSGVGKKIETPYSDALEAEGFAIAK